MLAIPIRTDEMKQAIIASMDLVQIVSKMLIIR